MRHGIELLDQLRCFVQLQRALLTIMSQPDDYKLHLRSIDSILPLVQDLLTGAPVHSAPIPCRSRRLVRTTALAYPRTFQRSSSSAPDVSQQV